MASAPTTPMADNKAEAFNPAGFEYRCRQYLHLRGQQEIAKVEADHLKAQLLIEIERHGLVPTNAEKSRRIDGRDFIATVTTGDTIEINDEEATKLELLLSQARRSSSFPLLFSRRTEYSLTQNAATVIEHTSWPKRFAGEIRAAYARCFKAGKRAPVLKVERRADVEQRDREAAEKKTKRTKKAAAIVAAVLIVAGVVGCAAHPAPTPSISFRDVPGTGAVEDSNGFAMRLTCPPGWHVEYPSSAPGSTVADDLNWAASAHCAPGAEEWIPTAVLVSMPLHAVLSPALQGRR